MKDAICSKCEGPIGLAYSCKFCGKEFCSKCQLPENHDCVGLKNVKSSSITYLPTASMGDFPKTFKIRKEFEAEELARAKLLGTYNKIKGYEKFESRREGNNWVIEGIVKIGKFIGTKRISFRIVIDAVYGKVIEKTEQPM